VRRLVACASLAAIAGIGLLAADAAAAGPAVRAGWSPLPRCEPCGPSPKMVVVQFENESTGWLAGAFGVARTDDGAKTWRLGTGMPGGGVTRASFSGSRGVAVGGFEGVAVSGDGGLTWKQYRPIPGRVYDVQALPDRLLAASVNRLYVSTDGGLVWKASGTFSGSTTSGPRIHFADATHGVAGNAFELGMTHDGGATWNTKPVVSYNGVRNGVFARDATTAFAVGVEGAGPSELVLNRTTDGATFARVDAPAGESVYRGLVDVAFTGPVGYAVGWEGALLRSTDAGATWVRETPPPSFERTTFRSVAVLSADRAIAVTYGGGIVTRDAPVVSVTGHPHRTVGLGMIVLAGGAFLGAGARVVVARPDAFAGGLLALGVVVGGAGAYSFTATDDVIPSLAIRALDEPVAGGVTLPRGTPSPVPSAAPSVTVAPSVTATPTASVSPTAGVTQAPPTAGPTSAPTTTAPTRRPTTPPPTTKAPGNFTVTPKNLAQACDANGLEPFDITLKNGTSSNVQWVLEFDRTNENQAWAGSQTSEGEVAAGASMKVTIYPDSTAVCSTLQGPTDFHVGVRQLTNSSAGGPLLGVVTVKVSP
jgi:photosystem II stability/assembly factor-like uncharacterized protein